MLEVLSIAARKKMSRMMKMKGKLIARKRAISMKRKAPLVKLKKRAQKKAIDYVATKLLGGKKRSELGQAGREALEKKLKKKQSLIKKLGKKMLPLVKKAEKERMAKKGEE